MVKDLRYPFSCSFIKAGYGTVVVRMRRRGVRNKMFSDTASLFPSTNARILNHFHFPPFCLNMDQTPSNFVFFCIFNFPNSHFHLTLVLYKILLWHVFPQNSECFVSVFNRLHLTKAPLFPPCDDLFSLLKVAEFRVTQCLLFSVLLFSVSKCADSSEHNLNFSQSALPKDHLLNVLHSSVNVFVLV